MFVLVSVLPELWNEAALEAAQNSGLSPRAFSAHWQLKGDEAISAAGIPTLDLARKVETLVNRFPNAGSNPDEKRQLWAALSSCMNCCTCAFPTMAGCSRH